MDPSNRRPGAATLSKTALNKLIKALQPEAIYGRTQHLVIILPSNPTDPLRELQKKAKACRLPVRWSYELVYKFDLEQKYRQGQLFLTTFCVPDNCLYQRNGTVVQPPWKQLDAVRERAVLNFAGCMKRAKAFYRGACFYWASADYPMTAFMLHQASELCLRAVVMAFTGEQVKTHTLAEQMTHVKGHLPELANFFAGNTEKEKHLLGLLEKAYCQVRYTHTYEITPPEIHQLVEQVRQLHQTAEQLMDQIISLYPGLTLPEVAHPSL